MSARKPPLLAARLIARMLPRNERDDTLGDLSERYHKKRAARGPGYARLWYWKQAAGFVARLTREKFRSQRSRRARQTNALVGRRRGVGALSSSFVQDLRYAGRTVRKQPLFAAVATLTLALGIGATTTVFSVVNGVLLKPLPLEDPEGLVGVWHSAPGWGFNGFMNQSAATYFTYREESRVFEDIGMWVPRGVSVTGLDRPERVACMFVTDGTLPILGIKPLIGRTFTHSDDSPDAAPTAVLSHGYWRLSYAEDSSVVGSTVTIDGQPHEIIGVLQPGFDFFQVDPAVYVPFRFDRSRIAVFGDLSYMAIARLEPGATTDQANADVARMIPLALEKFPGGMSTADIEAVQLGPDVHPLIRDVVGNVGTTLWIILGTVAMVLLIACANVANLFLVRAESRRREVALRTAIGAGRRQLARLFFAESLTLATLGGLLGLGLAYFGLDAVITLGSQQLPRTNEIDINASVLLFTIATTAFSGIVFGLFPVLKYGNPHLGTSLNEDHRGVGAGKRKRLVSGALVVSQMAFALVLVVGSGLLIRSYQAMRSVQPGFVRPDEVLTATITPTRAEAQDPHATAATHEQILRRVRAIPGVAAAGFTSSITMDGRGSNQGIHVEEFPVTENQAAPLRRFKWISPGYFETMGNPVLAGRPFSWADVHDRARVVVVTENFAMQYWGSPSEAIGKRIREGREQPWREIIGVVGDVFDNGANRPAVATVYWPPIVEDFWNLEVFARRTMVYAVRSSLVGGTGLLDEIRETVWSVHSTLPIASVQTLEDIYDLSMTRTSFTMVLLAIAASVALLIGAAGIYGVISYVVAQRTREIGVRMALGARHHDVSRMVLSRGLMLACCGILVGLGAAIALTRLMSSLLFGVSPVDPLTFGIVSVTLVIVALVATYLPSRRASRVDPMEALRAD